MMRYGLAGKRPGWDLAGLTRADKSDGYSEFTDSSGSVRAVVRTALLVEAS